MQDHITTTSSRDAITEQALAALVALGRKPAIRALKAEREHNSAQDEWLNEWIDEHANDPDDDEERDDLWFDAQQADDYEPFLESLRAELAEDYDITPEALLNALELMNNSHGAGLLMDRLDATYPPEPVDAAALHDAIETLAALDSSALLNAMPAGEFYNDQDHIDAEDLVRFADHFHISPAAMVAAGLVTAACAFGKVTERHRERNAEH
ncbi:hypothetical protein [Burkholderia vietnamiensis]|jgi:hypothetical protein|uniref:hypothetical protein n=1 Tax=Burkholderia vietnamiensis TaxID=60552 RepID=UPI00104183E2|nr:hypothetical protein [Burkholderia vietnamiensis]